MVSVVSHKFLFSVIRLMPLTRILRAMFKQLFRIVLASVRPTIRWSSRQQQRPPGTALMWRMLGLLASRSIVCRAAFGDPRQRAYAQSEKVLADAGAAFAYCFTEENTARTTPPVQVDEAWADVPNR